LSLFLSRENERMTKSSFDKILEDQIGKPKNADLNTNNDYQFDFTLIILGVLILFSFLYVFNPDRAKQKKLPTQHKTNFESQNSKKHEFENNIKTPSNLLPPKVNFAPQETQEPDFGPYMRELQRRIKRNWHPPRRDESKHVQVLFKLSKKGDLLRLNISKSSGNIEIDDAAIKAVKMSAPFRSLPPEYKGNDIDIQFTFDYNVF